MYKALALASIVLLSGCTTYQNMMMEEPKFQVVGTGDKDAFTDCMLVQMRRKQDAMVSSGLHVFKEENRNSVILNRMAIQRPIWIATVENVPPRQYTVSFRHLDIPFGESQINWYKENTVVPCLESTAALERARIKDAETW